jgi:ubiquinone/menaquinone biosynthesis C-methylase UbiE
MDQRTLDVKQGTEKVFHDKKFSSERRKNYYDLGFTNIIVKRMLAEMGDLSGKRVVEFGCGTGWFTRKLAQKGAYVWAFDISDEAVKRVTALVKGSEIEGRVRVDRMEGEKLSYDSNMFDCVTGIAVLHHLDLRESLKEIKRVLKVGGKAYFVEPLGHNPLLNLYRNRTPHLRSKDEMPLRFEQFPVIYSTFSRFEHKEYYLTSLFALFWYFIGLNGLVLKTRDILNKLDQTILSVLPPLNKYCWYTLLIMEK